MELVVFATSLKFFFVEGGEQFIVGIQTAKKIGLKATVRITIAGISFAVILFFLLFYSHTLISTKWLELALGIALYLFAARMFKEVIQKEDEEREFQEKAYKYGYITIVSLESVENATALAALTFIDISGALIGAVISIAVFIVIAVNSKHILARIPLDKLRLISGTLLAITATPLLIYSSGIYYPHWLHWIIPPLG
ncbi:MAG: hypothetical protein M3P08_10770 [Thermoproteota archaeon]|nr:hypothetical protein [Thermoproteota archaeon]